MEGGQRREAPPGAVGISTIVMELANGRRGLFTGMWLN